MTQDDKHVTLAYSNSVAVFIQERNLHDFNNLCISGFKDVLITVGRKTQTKMLPLVNLLDTFVKAMRKSSKK